MVVIEVRRYVAWSGNDVIGQWLSNLEDLKARARIAARLKDKASISHDESMARELRENPDFAAEYLRAAMEDEAEPRVLLVALRRVAEARGIAKVAKTAGIERESLYRALSPRGNPRFSTLVAVAKAMGLKLTFESRL